MVAAVTGLLEHVAGLMRQLVCVVGWVLLLSGVIGVLVHPTFSTEHLVTPGAGAVAVMQVLVRPGRRQGEALLACSTRRQGHRLGHLGTRTTCQGR